MKIIRPTEIAVEFENDQEAARYLHAYYAGEGVERLGFPILTDPRALPKERLAAGRAAVQRLSKALLVSEAADPEHAAPTYISGSSDRVYLISEMPARYIRNVLAMPATRQTYGLERRLEAELARRGERA